MKLALGNSKHFILYACFIYLLLFIYLFIIYLGWENTGI
jgi:hypothetical protein